MTESEIMNINQSFINNLSAYQMHHQISYGAHGPSFEAKTNSFLFKFLKISYYSNLVALNPSFLGFKVHVAAREQFGRLQSHE